MKTITLVVAVIFSFLLQGGGVQKQDTVSISISDITGNDLLQHCSSQEPFELNFCTGYIEGVRDGVMFAAVRVNQ
jgi:hypothetical protein